ncbi:transcriptional regulator [Salinadaptatus halalkaliphilus]|uniref:Transcriptional regulator n=1 Tax=Salinadaptatus halalkaliphilus TaxID=2419781 RepID=A0A4S3TG02_9EURY|nr:transcriptional regulator [Salinadaptatus halalkaliphilus]THE62801.1 transcriptional regulator [Salinadaptatus halalkaliphilus]
MDPRTKERVEQWDSRPFSDGYDGLSDLADTGFSGALCVTDTWLFMLNGRIVGIFGGDIEDIDGGSGTVYQAPHPSLPLLCSMEERGGETRAQYYTNDTPLEEVDDTLQDGSFTGYVELSENVLSGDYYAVYYGGRRMAAAYIGNAERLITGEEAFDRAAGEVGIYTVIDVDIEVTDVPSSESQSGSGAASGTATTTDSGTDAGVGPSGSTPDEGPNQSPPRVDDSLSGVGPTDSTDDGLHAGDTSEPTADPTASGIEPIDISGSNQSSSEAKSSPDNSIEGITGGESLLDETDDEGVTTSDTLSTEPHDDVDHGGSTDDETSTDYDASGSPVEDPDSVDSRSTGSPTESATDEPSSADAETPDSATHAQESADSSEGPAGQSSTLDPDEVEAAAAELEESEISWDESEGMVEADQGAETAEDRRVGQGDVEEPTVAATETEQTTDDAAADRSSEDEAESQQLEKEFDAEEQWRETRRIPSIDPEKTADPDTSPADTANPDAEPASGGAMYAAETADTTTPTAEASGDAARPQQGQSTSRQSDRGSSNNRRSNSSQREPSPSTDRLQARLERLEDQRDQLAETAEQLEAERDQLQAEKQELAGRVQQLQARIDELEADLERARSEEASDIAQASTQLSPRDALSGTNLFVRYDSKSQPTLKTAHDGDADREEVASNLRLEHHTEFDESDVAVAGQAYEPFLTSTMSHRFVDWLTEVLLYEIRDTGHANGLGDLYDAIPRIDRAELQSTVSLAEDDTEDVPDEVTFDVVAYDKMGNPLVLVTLNDSREPATKEMLAGLEEAASAVKANYPELAAAIAVTSSYFEPGALEVTEQATTASLLSRSSKSSYVNLSRKQGYHLCLVESRSEGFHMTVPEL